MPRVTVYVSDDLKARMDDIGESANWSGIAQRAFREATLTHAVRKEPTLSNVVERLRASKKQHAAQQEERGRKAGDSWARLEAEFTQLRGVARIDDVDFDPDAMSGDEAAAFVYTVANPDDPRPLSEELAGMLQVEEDEIDNVTPEYVRGFILGARAVWDEVSDKI